MPTGLSFFFQSPLITSLTYENDLWFLTIFNSFPLLSIYLLPSLPVPPASSHFHIQWSLQWSGFFMECRTDLCECWAWLGWRFFFPSSKLCSNSYSFYITSFLIKVFSCNCFSGCLYHRPRSQLVHSPSLSSANRYSRWWASCVTSGKSLSRWIKYFQKK